MMSYTDLLKKRRSIRDFEDKKIPAVIIGYQKSIPAAASPRNEPIILNSLK
jgi:hypothetical protein